MSSPEHPQRVPSDKGKWSLTDQPPSPSGRHLFDALISARLGPDLATFDDDHAVANAGLIRPAILAGHLGLREMPGEYVDLGTHRAVPTRDRGR